MEAAKTQQEAARETAGSTQTGAGDAAKKAKPSSGILPILVIGLGLIGASAGVTYVVVRKTLPPPVVTQKASATVPITFPLGEMYVNIAETKGTRVLKIVPYLVLSESRLEEQIPKYVPLLRDRVSIAASKMTIDELDSMRGRDTLKQEIVTLVNNALKDKMSGAVTDVYFHEFLIQ
jgi:flagellar basal body-associated protein FliL